MTIKEKLLFASPLIVLAVPLLLRARDSEAGLRQVMVKLTGPGAIDCNAMRQNGALGLTVKTGKSFFASSRLYEPTKSNYFWSGMVRTPDGQLFELYWQESPWYSLTPGKLNWIARVKNLKFMPNNRDYSMDGGNIMMVAEQARLLQKAGAGN